jgi:hypothetical protein
MVVTWMVWRGPGPVSFEPRYTQPKDGTAQTQATFSVAGDYILRATANDGAAERHAQVAVKVSSGTATTGGR